jgi:hypothetical protein
MIDNLLEGAKFLFENKNYKDSAAVLKIASKLIQDKFVLDKIYTNLRLCYFFANDVPSALEILELQESLNISTGFEIKRDKANFLRYVNRHEEAYNLALEISDYNTRNLALGWFEHKKGNIEKAFELTEKSRENNYWWKRKPNYQFKLWDGSKVENLVVVEESGFGDQIIFSRWIPKLKTLCNNLYYDGLGLESTFIRNFDIKSVQLLDKTKEIYAVPIMSLAFYLKIKTLDSSVYLTPNKTLVEKYHQKYPKTKTRIGLCVQGEKTHIETNLRTLPIGEMIENLKQFGEIVNLQKEIDDYHEEITYIKFDTWEDTLALIDTCDIIVTCDTSISHAAGALGKCTIVLMHAAAYFTWNHNFDISKSLWYNNAWCIHQDAPCDWKGAIKKCNRLINKILYEN